MDDWAPNTTYICTVDLCSDFIGGKLNIPDKVFSIKYWNKGSYLQNAFIFFSQHYTTIEEAFLEELMEFKEQWDLSSFLQLGFSNFQNCYRFGIVHNKMRSTEIPKLKCAPLQEKGGGGPSDCRHCNSQAAAGSGESRGGPVERRRWGWEVQIFCSFFSSKATVLTIFSAPNIEPIGTRWFNVPWMQSWYLSMYSVQLFSSNSWPVSPWWFSPHRCSHWAVWSALRPVFGAEWCVLLFRPLTYRVLEICCRNMLDTFHFPRSPKMPLSDTILNMYYTRIINRSFYKNYFCLLTRVEGYY